MSRNVALDENGPRGSRSNSVNYLNFILDQLADVEGFTFKKVFGGISFFRNGILIGAILGGQFKLVADNCSSTDAPCAVQVSYSTELNHRFFTVPDDVLDNKESLRYWVDQAYNSAVEPKDA